MIRRHLRITGRVQGVYYRAWFAEQARTIGLDGWVRNRADGSVEAVVQGASDAVDVIATRAWRGPPAARVADVIVTESATTDRLQGFEKWATL